MIFLANISLQIISLSSKITPYPNACVYPTMMNMGLWSTVCRGIFWYEF